MRLLITIGLCFLLKMAGAQEAKADSIQYDTIEVSKEAHKELWRKFLIENEMAANRVQQAKQNLEILQKALADNNDKLIAIISAYCDPALWEGRVTKDLKIIVKKE